MLSSSLRAQNNSFSIKSVVKDIHDEKPISFAYIHLEELNRTVISSSEGIYTITTHPVGYRTQSRIVEVNSDLDEIKLFYTMKNIEITFQG